MRSEFLETIRKEGIDKSSRSEAGNLKYEYYDSTSDPDELLLIEKWQNEDAIDFHKNQAHFARLGELKIKYVDETIIDNNGANTITYPISIPSIPWQNPQPITPTWWTNSPTCSEAAKTSFTTTMHNTNLKAIKEELKNEQDEKI